MTLEEDRINGPRFEGRPDIISNDFDRDMALTITQFLLSPDIPREERENFRKFYVMFSKLMALGNIERYDTLAFLKTFDQIVIFLEMRLFEEARKLEARTLMEMQLTRSHNGFYTLFGQHGIDRRETVQRIIDSANSPKAGGFWGRLLHKDKPARGSGMSNVGMEREV